MGLVTSPVGGSGLSTARLDTILGGLNSIDGTLDLSGSDMAVPTPVSPMTNAVLRFTVNGLPTNGGGLNWNGIVQVVFGVDIQINDAPSNNVLAQRIATTISGTSAGNVVTLTIDRANGGDVPVFGLSSDSANVVATLVTAGVAFAKNADVTNIVDNSNPLGTVKVMEYVNRISGAKESVTYS